MKVFIQRIQMQLTRGEAVAFNDVKLLIREIKQLESEVMKLKRNYWRGF
tara:strand:- start:131 stop:277 length:147 start_codon:yes stop_codon:yes gene_type:complete